VLNTCTTNWSTNLTFLVDGSGGITSFGEAKLQSPVSCTPHPLSGNTTREVLKVEGQKDNGGFHLRLGVASFEPAVSADLGGFALLISESICPSVRRTLDIPITGANVAERGLTGQITMGCAGSARDVLSADSQIKLTLGFSCADIPSSEKETDAGKLCQ
jgi:hypothetical protein